MKSNKIDSILETFRQYAGLFDSFDSVYLFGSILNDNIIPNDLDILLIYSVNPDIISKYLNNICSILEDASGLPIDLTVLSIEEEYETEFLKRIKELYLQLK